MPSYSYQGRNQQGESVSGVLEAASTDVLMTELQRRSIIPVNISEQAGTAKKGAGWSAATAQKWFQRNSIGVEELIVFSRQMYSLNKAGVPIIRALNGLAATVKNKTLQTVLADVAATLESGVDLASSLNRHPAVFSDLYVSVIHVGENTGRLDLAFKQVAGYLELERETKKRIGAATRYPMFVIIAIMIAVAVINVLVVPAFSQLFESFDAQLPWQTRVLIWCSNFTINNWYWLLLFAVASVFGWRSYVNTEAGRLWWDEKKLKTPLVGSIFERINLGRFARTYATVTSAGVPIIQALSVVANAVGNAYVADRIAKMSSGIERGESFSRTATASGLFSPLVLQMIAVGEETGNMDELLDEVADFYEQEVDYDLKKLGDRIEPILLIVVAGMVLVLALGVFLPMWDLSSVVK